ncbi:hypothetical protein [Amycolatopsis solani]|uniref:hypothetical protein n=1 Tax=Amycolatopsis solani TaxID=3028615 RepID=UPI0025AFEB54|nr:hypothetical protein [Amycolatopsis sp. MEP2-6]
MLVLKLVLAPLLVAGSSLAGRRWGPGVAGLLVAMPVVAGPILLITYLDHGAAFASRAASASLSGLVSLAVFAVVFARVGLARGWPVTVLVGWLGCLASDLALSFAPVPAWIALGSALAAAWAGTRLLPARSPVFGELGSPVSDEPRRAGSRGAGEPRRAGSLCRTSQAGLRGAGEPRQAGSHRSDETGPPSLPWWDLPARALATAGLVLVLTAAAGRLGPDRTGVLAPFPTGTTVVAAFALAQGGPAAAVATMRGVLSGLRGFAAFCFLVAVLTQPIGGWAFAVAVAVAAAVQWLTR